MISTKFIIRNLVLGLLAFSGMDAAFAQTPLPYTWGYNGSGQLGNGSTTLSTVPVAVTSTGALAGKTLKSIAVGSNFSVGLSTDGKLYTWGDNSNGQLGIGNFVGTKPLPVALATADGKIIAAVAAGTNHCLALTTDGLVYAWGENGSGQLGTGSTTKQSLPTAVNVDPSFSALAGKTVIAIAAGVNHSIALASDGTVYTWGDNSSGILGNNSAIVRSLVPVAVNVTAGVSALAGKTVIAIAGGGSHSVALTSDGLVFTWGSNFSGQLGNNTSTSNSVPVAVNVAAGTSSLAGKTVTAIATGSNHTMALASDGTVSTWGTNSNGELGNNGNAVSLVPVAVNITAGTSALAGKTVSAISAGAGHSVALATDGSVCVRGATAR